MEVISQIRTEQLALTENLVESFAIQFPTPSGLDPEATDDLVSQELRYNVMLSIQGYTDWLASHLWRKHLEGSLSNKEFLPNCDSNQQIAIAEKYSVDGELLSVVVSLLTAYPLRLPVVGTIKSGTVNPDLNMLKCWADHYDWSL